MFAPVKIHVLSDLHLGVSEMERPLTDADVVVLAGDIGPARQAAAWAMRLGKPVLYVLGNHEFYGGNIDRAAAELEALCAGTQVHLLDDRQIVIGGVRFLGSTLWSDFRLLGEGDGQRVAVESALRFMRDFSRIRCGDDDALFTPADAAARFARHAAWLDAALDTPHAGPTVVITHHAPSPRSIHPRFAGSTLNACFASDAEHLIGTPRAGWWIHGHTHDSFDYRLHGTRVVCNPRGYASNGVNENLKFDPEFTIEV
jgi:predicted phosphodiesterase